MLIRTKVAPSQIHGLGVFADEFIPKGTILWKYVAGFDLRFSGQDIEKLPDPIQEFIRTYAYVSLISGYYILSPDNARFYNHSKDPNTVGIAMDATYGEGADIATRDIREGEEITCDYEKEDGDARIKLGNARGYASSEHSHA